MRFLRPTAFAIAVACLMTVVPRVMACGHCIEDKVAATYDYSVMTAAQRHGDEVLFAEIQGPVSPDRALEGWILRSIGSCTGVIAGTPRVSLSPAALSFAYDPRRTVAGALLRKINLRLSQRGLRAVRIDAHLLAMRPPDSKQSAAAR